MLLTLVVGVSSFLPVIAPGAAGTEVAVMQPERAAAPGLAAQKEAMKKLDWLSGDWEGPAKYDSGRGADAWMEVRQSEAVKVKMGGRVLLVEGTGRMQAGGQERVIFEALATISYDARTKEYQMRAFGPEGAIDPTLEVGEKSLIWSFAAGGEKRRYTAKLDEQGRWFEMGERSTDDGKTWAKFVEMTLEKKK